MDSVRSRQTVAVPVVVLENGRKTTKIVNKYASLMLIFDDYDEREYRKDFEEWVKYQTTAHGKEVYLSIFKDIKQFSYVQHSFFREKTFDFMARTYFSSIRDPLVFVTPELNVILRIIKNEFGEWEFQDDASTEVDAVFTAGGKWFIQNIAAPLTYYRSIDYRYMERFLGIVLIK